VKINRIQAIIGLAIVSLTILLFIQNPFTKDRDNQENQYMETEITAPDPLKLGAFIGETSEIGRLASAILPVTGREGGDDQITCRGFSNVTTIERDTGIWVPESQRILILLDGENKTIQYPVTWDAGEFSGTLQYLMGSRRVSVEGERFNYTAWNGEQYQVLRLTEVSPYSVRYDPTPLSPSQVQFSADAQYYHLNDTVKLSITNLSEDWLNVGRNIELYREMNGSLVEAQEFPEGYLVTDELLSFFPGTFWTQPIPLYHLEPGDYTVVKEVSHGQGAKVEVETSFTVAEDWVSKANATHRFALRAMNCTLPDVPPRLPLPRVVHLPITVEEAEEIAVDVFGFEEPLESEEDRFTTVRSRGRSLEFMTRYDVFYSGEYGSFNAWNEARVVELAEALVSELEHYWVDATPLNYSVKGVGPSHWRDGSVLEVGVRYQLTLEGVPLMGPGADFCVSFSDYVVSGCEIRRPVLSVEGYEYVKTSPAEAVQRMLKGESDTGVLGFEVLGARPLGSEVTVNKVSLAYYTANPGGFSWLVPIYVIEGVFHVDPVVCGEETMEFEEYILATGFPYERTMSSESELAGLTVRVETDKAKYLLDEMVRAEVKLVNDGDIPIHLNVSQHISLNGVGADGTAARSYPLSLDSVDVNGNSSLSLGVYPFKPEAGGLYVLEFSGSYTSVYVSDDVQRTGFNVSVRKPVLKTGEIVAYNFGCVEPMNGSYVMVWSSHGEHVWTSDPFDEWIKIDDAWHVPYVKQLADGQPMILSEEGILGLWGYTWYDAGGDKIMDGYFKVEWMIGQNGIIELG
jgi:hypothetical protein